MKEYPYNKMDVEDRMVSCEEELRGIDYEAGFLFDSKGYVIRRIKGWSNGISMYSNREVKERHPFPRKPQDIISSHYHPVEAPFSFGDIQDALAMGELETRVVDDKYLYVMRLPRRSWGSREYSSFLVGVELVYANRVMENVPHFKRVKSQGNEYWQFLDAAIEIRHDCWSYVANKMGFSYTRVKRKFNKGKMESKILCA